MINYLLSYIAIVLFVAVYLLDSILLLFNDVQRRKWYKLTSGRSREKAFKTDVIANWLFPSTWNFLFSWKGGYKFGKFGETLSSCLGRKKKEKTLSYTGLFLYLLLYAIDVSSWKKGGHCEASIMTDLEIENFINKKEH